MVYANSAQDFQRSRSSRSPNRITITIPFRTFRDLESRSVEEGRSMSNLAAYLLERGLADGLNKL